MTPQPKKKMCWNCEGSAPFEEEYCPFCGVYLTSFSIAGNEQAQTVFPPPYSLNTPQDKQEIPEPLYHAESLSKPHPKECLESLESYNELSSILIPTILLLGGVLFLFFSLALFLFSSNGTFTLQWKATYWFVYLLISLPMLFFGWRLSSQIK